MVICFFGKRGSGKTHTIKGQLIDCKPPVVIIDILGNFGKLKVIQTNEISQTILKVDDYVKKEKEHGVNKIPIDQKIIVLQTHDYNLAIDYLSAVLWKINGGTLILDEVDCFEFSEAPCFDQIIRYGRNHGVDIITGCRRPAELSKNITAAANKFYCFGTHEPRDVDYFREIFGERAYELMRCPKYSGLFLDYDNEETGRFKVDKLGNITHAEIATALNQPVLIQDDQPETTSEVSEGEKPSDSPEERES